MITFDSIKQSVEIHTYIEQADASLIALGFTEHSFAHCTRCAVVGGELLHKLGYGSREVELVKIAGYMHDIGNVINRTDHAQSGAVMAFRILDKMGMEPREVASVITAIGNHDEQTAHPVNAISAALILADKSDVRRSRVRNKASVAFDIHDRVNYSVLTSQLEVLTDEKKIILRLAIDKEICPIVSYFEIFMNRMLLCRRAASFFGMHFSLDINGQILM